MKDDNLITEINSEGFTIVSNVYSETEINHIISFIENTNTDKDSFRRTANLFAIRQFHKEVPETLKLIFNKNVKEIINNIFGNDYFITKSIYFDKPELSNWFVAYHQDLTISVDKKVTIEGYKNWTTKDNQFAVIPPLHILENNFTIRIHLDKTTSKNGALKVINKSHNKEVYRPENINFDIETETICEVEKGGIMIMKPLLLHASNKTTDGERRRVIHIEFSNHILPNEIEWSEKTFYN
jgi:ectoine hydroxylase-related dioxygenase (phytanoyl-CoA dioxygenase family)